MSQRRQLQRRRRRRRRQQRRKRLLTGLSTIIAIVATLAGVGANIHANGREHSSRQANDMVKELDELGGSLVPWINGAKDVFAAADESFRTTGEWRRGTEFRDKYQSAYHAGTKVQNLQSGMSDARLKTLLDALRGDIQRVCTSTSFHSANEASKAMLRHWGETKQRIKELSGLGIEEVAAAWGAATAPAAAPEGCCWWLRLTPSWVQHLGIAEM